MLEAVVYIRKEDGVMICRCCGEGGYLELPEAVDSLPVISLADHVFAREASVRLKKEKKLVALRDPGSGQFVRAGEADSADMEGYLASLPAMAGEVLHEIALPVSLQSVGAYAFYGCRSLHRLSIPVTLKELGSGAFVACNHLRQIIFVAAGNETGEDSCMRNIIGDVSYEIEVIVKDRSGNEVYRLVFPEYYEESIENTPARIFIMRYEGTGYKYRQCFECGKPDLERYDALFREAVFQEYPDTVMRLAADRMLYPYMLGDAAANEMLGWMKENRGFFDEKLLAYFLSYAGKKKNAEAVSLLMHYQHAGRGRVSYEDRFRL